MKESPTGNSSLPDRPVERSIEYNIGNDRNFEISSSTPENTGIQTSERSSSSPGGLFMTSSKDWNEATVGDDGKKRKSEGQSSRRRSSGFSTGEGPLSLVARRERKHEAEVSGSLRTSQWDLDLVDEGAHDENFNNEPPKEIIVSKGILKRTCLDPNYSLKNQLFLSFGTVSIVAIIFVALVAISTSKTAANRVEITASRELKNSVEGNLGSSARYAAEAVTKAMAVDLTEIIAETTRDRFVGYPNHEGYENDSHVPFHDILTDTNKYPLKATSFLPPDWQFQPNVNSSNHKLHLQNRWTWYGQSPEISTASPTYSIQGSCDPSATNRLSPTYYEGCTEENNNMISGGKVQPTPTNWQLAQKSADFAFLLKPLYEYHQTVRLVGIYFANSGAGSVVRFPAERKNGNSTYESIGCDWMEAPNPMDPSRPIATSEEIARCHKKGLTVNGREYNPLEREWCKEQALDPFKSHSVGPYFDAFFENLWLMSFGRAVYDRLTKEFIACTLADVSVDSMSSLLNAVKIGETSRVALVRWDNGILVASPDWDFSKASNITNITDPNIGIGVDVDTFNMLKSKFDFSGDWKPAEVKAAFENTANVDGKVIAGFPIPVPQQYDAHYNPEYMVVVSVERSEALAPVLELEEDSQNHMVAIIRRTSIIALVGLVVILGLLFVVSRYLTKPLHWMNQVADQVIDKFGQDLDKNIDLTNAGEMPRWSPRTEIGSLVKEFETMVSTFSGSGTAKVAQRKLTEVKNAFVMFTEHKDLYWSRSAEDFRYSYDSNKKEAHPKGIELRKNPPPRRRHFGRNIRDAPETDVNMKETLNYGETKLVSSPLFWWIIATIMTPLLVTMIVISTVVVMSVSDELPTLVKDVENAYLQLNARSLTQASHLRAIYASQVMEEPLRDLYVLSRSAEWLYAGSIERSDSFTRLATGSEACKNTPSNETCAYILDPSTSPCACDWPDKWGKTECQKFEGIDTRHLQTQFFEGSSQGADQNGDRFGSASPDDGTTPSTTKWWSDVRTVPGNEKKESAAGHETTYDRLRVFSALSVVQMPLYNFRNPSGKSLLGQYIGYEADGMFAGYSGCEQGSSLFAFFQSTEDNGAFEINSTFCPLGKYGYDCRCRDWYVTGKNRSQQNGDPLYVTAPYVLAGIGQTAQSATSPLVDVKNKKHIGQTLVDFLVDGIVSAMKDTSLIHDGFPILITALEDNFGADTVVGPGFSLGDSPTAIEKLVVPMDNCSIPSSSNCRHWRDFKTVLTGMRLGQNKTTTFTRTTGEGEEEEIQISYAPVRALNLRTIDSSNFAQGVETLNDSLVFSLALAQPLPMVLRPFEELLDAGNQLVNVAIIILVASIVVAAFLVLFISARVTVSIIVPINQLVNVVRSINSCAIEVDMPHLEGGSLEVSRVYGTFERLYKVVRGANTAYFSGDLEKAYEVLCDAVLLFTQMNNKKAIAVANNNIGNTMLAMYRTMKSDGDDEICGMSITEVIERGILHFDRAIDLGEEAIDYINETEGFSLNYLVFMQQLANRYFNRAMFLLTVRNDHSAPSEAERLGFKDLIIARDMDVEFYDQSISYGYQFDEETRYNLILGRIRGLLILMDMSYQDEWGIEDLFEDALTTLKTYADEPSHRLFRDLGPAGKMQQLDCALLEYTKKVKGDTTDAARIAIRMLIEDEYVLLDAMLEAVNTLIGYNEKIENSSNGRKSNSIIRRLVEYNSVLHNARVRLSTRLEHSGDGDTVDAISIRSISSARRSSSIKESGRGDVTMETF